jgi:hypothetical protein
MASNSRTYVLADANNEHQVLAAVRQVMGRDNRGNEVPKVNALGVPVWEFEVLVQDPVEGVSTSRVRVACGQEPDVTLLAPIRFGGRFTLKEWEFGGRQGISVAAESFTQESRPSSARPPAPASVEPKDNGKVGASA